MKKHIVLIFLFLLMASNFVSAEKVPISATGMYVAGAEESLNSAKKHALEDAMRIAIEQAGVMVSSYSKTKNMILTEDEVSIVASKIIKVKDKRFEVDMISDSEIKVTVHINADVDTDNINEDIVKLKEENKKLENENTKFKTKEQAYNNLKKISSVIKKDMYKKYPSNNLTAEIKTDENTDYQTCINNYYLHMIQGNYNDAYSDITYAFLTYWQSKNLTQANIKNKRYYIDEAIFKLYLLRVESYIAQGEYYFAYDRIIALMIKSKVFNYIPKENDLMLMVKYGDALHDYLSLYEPEREKKVFEKYKNNPPDALP